MILKKWEDLPSELKNDDVKEYYDILCHKRGSIILKRLLDIVVSILLLVLLSPVFLVLAFMIKVDSKGPVFYRQERVTSYNKTFRIFKFRTMTQNADKVGSLVTVANDTRITKVGSKIRKCRLDELPQILNVISGDMSFVGARPEVRKYVDNYSNEMMATLLMPAGVTSLASIKYKDEDEILDKYMALGESVDSIYIGQILPQKMIYNLEYLRKFSFFGDISLLIKTVLSVI